MTTRKSGSASRRRTTSRAKKPATIDLEAKKTSASGAQASSTADKATSNTTQATAKTAAPSTISKAADTSSTEKTSPPLGRNGAKPDTSPKKSPSPSNADAKTKPKQSAGFLPMLASGLIGGVSVAAILAGLQLSGVLNFSGSDSSVSQIDSSSAQQIKALEAKLESLSTNTNGERLGAIEKAIAEIRAAPTPDTSTANEKLDTIETEIDGLKSILDKLASTDSGEVPDSTQLTAALAKADQRIEKVETTLSDLLAAGNEGIASTEERLGELTKKFDEFATKSDESLAPISNEIAAIQSSVKTLSESVEANSEKFEKLQSDSSQLQKSIASVKASEKVARSVAVNALGSALKNDDSIVLAIASLESLGAKSTETSRLSELAASGIPSQSELLSGLEAITNTVQNPVQNSDGGTLSDKFWANARNLVTFRSSGPQEGNSSIAVLSRVKSNIEIGQLDDALIQWKQLPIETQGAGKEWVKQLELRIEAFSLYHSLSKKLQNEAS